MDAATEPPPEIRTVKFRRCAVYRKGGTWFLRITIFTPLKTRTNIDTTVYRMIGTLPSWGRKAFRLFKHAIPGKVYDVLLDGKASRCDCEDFLKHEGRKFCKHIKAIQSLDAEHRLDLIPIEGLLHHGRSTA